MNPGEDIIVDYQGHEHEGEYVKPAGHGWSFVTIRPDPVMDYWAGKHFTNTAVDIQVCVRDTRIRRVES